jgi:phage terminase small subunit
MKREVKKKKTVKKVKRELTNKQQMFCLYYIKNFNATQAYLKAYGCSYNTAMANGYASLRNTEIRKEITRLKNEKAKAIMLSKNDIVERYMRIAFADMTDFVEWGRVEVPVMNMFGPVEVEDKETGKKVPLTKEVNDVRFKESSKIDGGLVCQVKQGKDGASIKLEDRQKALDWLADYFEMNPMNKHKRDFDLKKLDIEKERLILLQNKSGQSDTIIEDDGFLEALKGTASEVWSDDSQED